MMQRAAPNADPTTTAAAEEPRFRTWPITSTQALAPQLVAMGLEVPIADIDGTPAGEGAGGGALSDALVSVGTLFICFFRSSISLITRLVVCLILLLIVFPFLFLSLLM